MSVQERFRELLFALNKNAAQLAKELSTSPTAIGNILKGDSLPSSKIIIPLIEKYPEINIYWLLVGEGKTFRKETNENKQVGGNKDDDSKIQKLTTEIKYLKKEIKVLEASNTTLSNQIKDKDMIISLLQKK
jgi:transcriptional regulator with XRE-family HTH domain